jgi:aspartyl-tRNA(Asn)/glutamyl-tRNA(Gln) amidotransferase subunit A
MSSIYDSGLSRRTFLDASLAGVAGLALSMYERAASASSAASTDEICFLNIEQAAPLLRARKLSPVELTRTCLARIEALNPALNAFITVTADSALAQAQRAQAELQQGHWRGPLHGIPIALKDLIDTAGVRTTAASALFKDRIPEQDAAVVARLKDAGAVLLGKLNMQEFAYGGTSVPSYFGRVCNPWDLARVTGGSSGGSAAAVAAGLCYAALGSDTGGSVRQPAAFCGIVGLKPTYGRVSNRGIVPLSPSMDHIGPLTRCVTDTAMVLQAIAGYDPSDITSQDRPVTKYRPDIGHNPSRLRVGLPREFFYASLDPDVQTAIDQALTSLGRLGVQIQDVALEASTDRTVFRAEAYAYHVQYMTKTPELYQPETLAKLRFGAGIDAPAYISARRELERLRRSTLLVFSAVDFLVTPTTSVPAPKASDYPSSVEGALALDALLLRNTRPFNMYGFPTISIPCGMTRSGLPIGLQISTAPWQEQPLLALARAFEAATNWHTQRPPGIAPTHSAA